MVRQHERYIKLSMCNGQWLCVWGRTDQNPVAQKVKVLCIIELALHTLHTKAFPQLSPSSCVWSALRKVVGQRVLFDLI